jgi:hypothetical protein
MNRFAHPELVVVGKYPHRQPACQRLVERFARRTKRAPRRSRTLGRGRSRQHTPGLPPPSFQALRGRRRGSDLANTVAQRGHSSHHGRIGAQASAVGGPDLMLQRRHGSLPTWSLTLPDHDQRPLLESRHRARRRVGLWQLSVSLSLPSLPFAFVPIGMAGCN